MIRNLLALAIAIGVLSVPFLVVRVSYEIAFVGASPEVEQLRSDMKYVATAASEDVMGQATKWNQTIRRMQAYNAQWWGDPFIPDDWDAVALLPIPDQE
jgi:hypothetical protein